MVRVQLVDYARPYETAERCRVDGEVVKPDHDQQRDAHEENYCWMHASLDASFCGWGHETGAKM